MALGDASAWLSAVGRLALLLLVPADLLWKRVVRPRRAVQSVRRIVVIVVSGIGDTILTMPALANLRRAFPKATLTAVVSRNRGTADLLAATGLLDEIVEYDPRARPWAKIAALRRVRRQCPELAITFFPCRGWWGAVVAWTSGAGVRVAHRYHMGPYADAALLYTCTAHVTPRTHFATLNLDLLRTVGIEASFASVLDGDREDGGTEGEWAEAFLARAGVGPADRLIGMHPGCEARYAAKRWPAASWNRLLRSLTREHGVRIVVFGGTEERQLIDDLRDGSGLSESQMIAVIGLELPRVTALIRRCAAFVSADSGLGHIAAIAGIPQVVIFGPSDPRLTAPLNPMTTIIRRDLPCSPCHRVGQPIRCPIEFQCLSTVEPDDVLAAVAGQLANAERSRA